jgi:hypothetical protein
MIGVALDGAGGDVGNVERDAMPRRVRLVYGSVAGEQSRHDYISTSNSLLQPT